MATPEAARMASIVADHASLLRSAGFRKRRHCFNRHVDDGLVHVVNFWMAPKEPPAWTRVPGMRERVYGQFRLDYGVYVPEMRRSGAPRTAWINEYNCQFRQIFSGDRRLSTDFGWSLEDPKASSQVGSALSDEILPWLASFSSHEAVLTHFENRGPVKIGMSNAGGLDIADLYRALGRGRDERRVLETYVAEPQLIGHARYLVDYLQEHGHADLVDRIVVD